MARKKSKKRKSGKIHIQKRTANEQALQARVQEQFPDHPVTQHETRDGVKMSEVLKEFAEPYLHIAETTEEYRKMLAIATVAWNTTLFPEEKRASAVDEVLRGMPRGLRRDAKEIIQELMERKERLFPQYRRMIMDFEVTDSDDDWHVTVISTAEPFEAESG